jgi:predicted metal-dependent hydrolase
MMRFLVRLANKQYSAADKRRLTANAYNAVKGLDADIGNLRVGSSAVELDLLIESEWHLKEALTLLEKEVGPMITLRKLDVKESPIEPGEAIKLGLELFNEERYWESHEALEVAWRKAEGAEKEILQGIILLAAALVHLQKDEPNIALSVMSRASAKLERHAGDYHGINISEIRRKVSAMLATSKPDFFKIAAAV